MSATLDEALEMLRGTGPEFEQDEWRGLSNHGPMAAEAMLAMDRPDGVLAWVEEYRRDLREAPTARDPIDPAAWQPALGDYRRLGDWRKHFERELAEEPWQTVLDRWTERLAPGFAAAATHGVIRTGHAARGLGESDNELRRGELAGGLAYWASRYEELPGARSAVTATMTVEQAAEHIPHIGEEKPGGLIMDHLRTLGEPFAPVAGMLDTSGDTDVLLTQITRFGTRVFLDNAHSPGRVIALIHGVTGPSALRLIQPHVRPNTTRLAVRYAWQTAAAVAAGYGPATGVERGATDESSEPDNDLPDEAI